MDVRRTENMSKTTSSLPLFPLLFLFLFLYSSTLYPSPPSMVVSNCYVCQILDLDDFPIPLPDDRVFRRC